MELPGELLPGAASLILTGGKQALVEGHRGIVEYSQEQIVLALKRGKLILSGSGMQLRAMNAGELLISGSINNVEWA